MYIYVTLLITEHIINMDSTAIYFITFELQKPDWFCFVSSLNFFQSSREVPLLVLLYKLFVEKV